jgi:hypothetical protein
MPKPRVGEKILKEALEELDLPYEIVEGTKHHHLRISGRLVCVLPKGKGSADKRQMLNVRARIRRAAKEIKSCPSPS